MAKVYKIFALIMILAIIAVSFFFLKNRYFKNIKPTSAKIQTSNDAKTADFTAVPEKDDKKTIKILFLGDLMFDRYIREVSVKRGSDFIFEKVKNLLSSNDLAVANLEGPITNNQSVSIGTAIGAKNHLVFTFDNSFAKSLNDNNIKLVNIGNNHILNFGQNGLNQTEKYLVESNIEYFGDTGLNKPVFKTINGYDICFINYNQFVPGSLERALENINNLEKQADIIVVYTHWGTEYKTDVTENVKNLGHKFIDAGADLVIGSHPHVIEPKEQYKERWIYYSLGNFIFDQYFSPETKKGLAVEATISPNGKIECKDILLILDNNGQTSVNEL